MTRKDYQPTVFYVKLTFVNPSEWSDPAPFYYQEDSVIQTFETYEAADSCARVLFGKNFFVTAKVVRSN